MFVALLFVAVAFSGTISWLATRTWIDPPDRVMQLVPRNAVAYVHASRPEAVAALNRLSTLLPDGLAASEVAVFAVPGDNAMRWAGILRWRRAPDVQTREALRAQGGEMLDDHEAVVGDVALATTMRLAAASRTSLADDDGRADAIRAIARRHAVHGYADTVLLTLETTEGNLLVSLMSGTDSLALEPVVAGASLRNGGLKATVVPHSQWQHIGERPDPRSSGVSETPFLPADAVLRGEALTVHVPQLLTGNPLPPPNHPAPAQLQRATVALQQTMVGPYALWLFSSAVDATPAFLIRLPSVTPQEAKKAVAAYMGTREPATITHAMPDGDEVTEYARSESWMTAANGDGDLVYGSEGEIGSFSVGSDGQGGTLLGSGKFVLNAYRAAPRYREETSAHCRIPNRMTVLSTEYLRRFPWKVAEIAENLGLTHIDVGISVENSVYICGYQDNVVDIQ